MLALSGLPIANRSQATMHIRDDFERAFALAVIENICCYHHLIGAGSLDGHPPPALNLRMRPVTRAQDALGRGRQLDMLDAELAEGINNRIRDGSEARRDAALAAAPHPKRVCRGRQLAGLGL